MLPLPSTIQQHVSLLFEHWHPQDRPLSAEQCAILGCSEFIVTNLQQHPSWWQHLQACPPKADEWQHYATWLAAQLQGLSSETALMQQLRLFRRHMMVRIAWMQCLQQVSTADSLRQLSELADSLVTAARDRVYQQCCQEMGIPQSANGVAQPLLILAMGKLGGGELNFSSDIDLIFTYPENGYTSGGRKAIENSQFFTRMGQRLIRVLDHKTSDGLVYRVDMRLRPFGDSGPLVMSFAAMEDYYQEQGRDWERYAMVKARVLDDPDKQHVAELQQMLKPFIYRRYIDFSVIQSLRSMKGNIAREVRRRGLKNNIKLGAGGIRECEFIVQVFQLIRGGRQPSLQQRSFLAALSALQQAQLMTDTQSENLRQAWLFLRRLENLLQSLHDQQTQTLPEQPLDQIRLAFAMGYQDWQTLLQQLHHHMAQVSTLFSDLIGEDPVEEQKDETRLGRMQMLWQDDQATLEQQLLEIEAIIAENKPDFLQQLRRLKLELQRRTIGPRGRVALEQLMPQLLDQVIRHPQPDQLLCRIQPLLAGIVNRSTYLELLTEYPLALKQLLSLCHASPMIATQLTRYPLLLDELLDPVAFAHPSDLDAYKDDLRQYLMRIPEEDQEQRLEALCQFRQIQSLRIAMADISDNLNVLQVSDHLTWLAEAIIEAVIHQAWKDMTQRYGVPSTLALSGKRGFAVIGYGKLGGWELGYSSDLDLVFLYDCPQQVMTEGARQIEAGQFYLKLAQRIIHLFNSRTLSGTLYSVDARLRPSGSAGLLVTSLAAFSLYQQEEAWVWEHQALIRARLVFGAAELDDHFQQIRRQILCQARPVAILQYEVRQMREKMRQYHTSQGGEYWDIKQDEGGIIDVEFIVQYLVLRYAAQYPLLTDWTDNIRCLNRLAKVGVLSRVDAEALSDDYLYLRNCLHRKVLQAEPSLLHQDELVEQRRRITTCWQNYLMSPMNDETS